MQLVLRRFRYDYRHSLKCAERLNDYLWVLNDQLVFLNSGIFSFPVHISWLVKSQLTIKNRSFFCDWCQFFFIWEQSHG